MTPQQHSHATGHIYRVDKFKVPAAARQEFLGVVQGVHQLLRTLPGFEGDFLLEQSGGPGAFNIVTIAIWKDQAAFQAAKARAEADRAQTGFNPQAFMVKLGIQGDLADYRELA